MARVQGSGRAPTVMTPERIQARARVAKAYADYQARVDRERAIAQAEIAALVEERSMEELAELRASIRSALDAGVPKAQLQTHEVLGSTDQGKVNRLMGGRVKRAQRAHASLEWLGDGTARIWVPGFPTTSEAPDYPGALSGVVRRDAQAAGGWAVEVDDTDEPGLPGHLRWEFEHAPDAIGETLDRLAAL